MVTARVVFANDGGEIATVKFSEKTGELKIDSDEDTIAVLKNIFQERRYFRPIGHFPSESGKTDGFREETFTGTQSEDHFAYVLEYRMGVSFEAVDIELTPN